MVFAAARGGRGATLLVPPLRRRTDNAAMIAYAGWLRCGAASDPLSLNAVASELPLGPRLAPGEACSVSKSRRHALGQHFLIDGRSRSARSRSHRLEPGARVLEIGPDAAR